MSFEDIKMVMLDYEDEDGILCRLITTEDSDEYKLVWNKIDNEKYELMRESEIEGDWRCL